MTDRASHGVNERTTKCENDRAKQMMKVNVEKKKMRERERKCSPI